MNAALRIFAAVAEASHEQQLERALERLVRALHASAELQRFEWREGELHLVAQPRGGEGWRVRRLQRSPRPHRAPDLSLAPNEQLELRMWFAAEVAPRWLAASAYRGALERVLARGAHTRSVITKVAALSRRAHIAKRELERERGRDDLPRLVARSPAMRELLERARAVARYPTSVLIRGASGAGKQVVANFVHANSRRARTPMVEINCGALPENLAESELFGHERGAFTGALRQHRGVFERAHRGTLFLDEVAELTPYLQVKLLRVLQEGSLTRVGGERSIEVDVRVIAATNQPLDELVRRGAFREDLYFRLAVYPLEVPSLSARREDIPALVDELLEQLCARLGRTKPTLAPGVLARLVASPWPGNVRELANALEAALIASSGELRLPPQVGVRAQLEPVRAQGPVPSFEAGARDLIARALRASEGKIYGPGGAAELLELHPATLQGKMRRLGLVRRDFVGST